MSADSASVSPRVKRRAAAATGLPSYLGAAGISKASVLDGERRTVLVLYVGTGLICRNPCSGGTGFKI